MWPRHIELMLGAWLAISPFVFRVPSSSAVTWAVDLTAGFVVGCLALACYVRRLRRAHLVTLALSVGVAIWAWAKPRPLAPIDENHVIVGLLLAMLAVCPSRASAPPPTWTTSPDET